MGGMFIAARPPRLLDRERQLALRVGAARSVLAPEDEGVVPFWRVVYLETDGQGGDGGAFFALEQLVDAAYAVRPHGHSGAIGQLERDVRVLEDPLPDLDSRRRA